MKKHKQVKDLIDSGIERVITWKFRKHISLSIGQYVAKRMRVQPDTDLFIYGAIGSRKYLNE